MFRSAKVSFIGRLTPEISHGKAGAINHVLYNEDASGHYVTVLDSDMEPHPLFLQVLQRVSGGRCLRAAHWRVVRA
jgi:Glycosyl transferase family 2